MSTFFNHKNSLLIGTVAGSVAYGVTLYTSPSIIYMANFIVGSALISLLGPVAAAAMGWALPFIAVLAMGGLAGWLMSSFVNMFNVGDENELNDAPMTNNNVTTQPLMSNPLTPSPSQDNLVVVNDATSQHGNQLQPDMLQIFEEEEGIGQQLFEENQLRP